MGPAACYNNNNQHQIYLHMIFLYLCIFSCIYDTV